MVVRGQTLVSAVQRALQKNERWVDIWLRRIFSHGRRYEYYEAWERAAFYTVLHQPGMHYLFVLSEEERLLLAPHQEDAAYLEVWITLRLLRENTKEEK